MLGSVPGAVLSSFRAVIGFLFACHGAASLFGVFGGAHGGGTIPPGTWPGWYAAMIQFVCGTLVAIGAVTRIAAVLASGSMAYAYFIVHQPNGLVPILNGGEAATQFCWGFLLVAALGAGPFSIDALISKARRGASAEATPGRAKERVTA